MRYIKLFFISGVVFFLLITSITLLFPSTVIVSRAINIEANKQIVYKKVKDIHNWKSWMEVLNTSNFKLLDSFHATQNSNTISIIKSDTNNIISTWISANLKKQTSTLSLLANPNANVTVVHWEFKEHLNWYPWEKFGSMMNDKVLGTMMETNLNALKNSIENNHQ